ncbi:MAG: hypothetical protein RL722_2647 [Pseudomonadota bacterium]|jgi:thiol-disulfide isomerase/thioredoxin
MNRRSLVLAGVAVVAAGAGLYVSQRREATVPAAEATPATPGGTPGQAPAEMAAGHDHGASAPAKVDLWAQRYNQPGGGELVFASLKGKPLVVNFWATWCPPCVKEMPELDRFHKEFSAKGWQVVGVAVDGPTPVREFLQKTPVSFPIGLAGFGGAELARDLGNSSGGLPFTVVFDASGKAIHTRLGQTSYDELKGWAGG